MFEITKPSLIRPYEAVVVMHPDASEDEQKNLFTKNKGIIEGFRGQLNHVDTWGKRRLANPIGKIPKAFYFHATFNAAPEAVAELERTMGINDKVLRFIHTRLEDETDLGQFVEKFKLELEESAKREREREAKFQAKKAARMQKGPGDRGDRKGGRGDKKGGGYDDDYED